MLFLFFYMHPRAINVSHLTYAVSTAVCCQKLPDLFCSSSLLSLLAFHEHFFKNTSKMQKIFQKSALRWTCFLKSRVQLLTTTNYTLYVPLALDHHLAFCCFSSRKEGLQRSLKAVVLMDYFIKGCHRAYTLCFKSCACYMC